MAKKVLDVPKLKQLPWHCGPASLSMVLSYLGHDISQEKIAEYWGDQEHLKDTGIYSNDLVLRARDLGFKAHPYYNLELEDVIRIIDRELPIIARVQGFRGRGMGHMVVIRGYDTNPSAVWVNDPGNLGVSRIPYREYSPTFRQWWRVRLKGKESRNYGIVVRER